MSFAQRVFNISGRVHGSHDVTFRNQACKHSLGVFHVPGHIEGAGGFDGAPQVEAELIAEGRTRHILWIGAAESEL